MFILNILTSTKPSIVSVDDHCRDLWVIQGTLHALCNGMTHCRTKEKTDVQIIIVHKLL